MQITPTAQENITPAREFNAALLADYVQFIDRGERTTSTYITNLRQFIAWLKFSNITNPVRSDILAYKDYLLTEHYAIQLTPGGNVEYRTDGNGRRYKTVCKPNTAKQYLQSVCHFFKWAAANGYYPDIAANIHSPKIKNNTHRKQALTAADVLSIENSIKETAERRTQEAATYKKDVAGRTRRATEQDKRLYALYLLAVNTGLRTVELARANIKDIEIINGNAFIYIWGKGHAEPDTKKPLAADVYTAIIDYLGARSDKPTPNSPLFVATGNRNGGKRLNSGTIGKMLKKALINAGYNSERITAHSLRHTAGTAVMELSGNIYTTQMYMRHSNPSTTEIYLHNNIEVQEIQLVQELYNYYHKGQ